MTTENKNNVVQMPTEKIYASMDDLLSGGATDVEYKVIDGFRPGEKLRIGSVSAGDIMEWSEANDGEAKKTAGLRLITKSLVGPEPNNIRFADDPKNIQHFRKFRHKETERIVREILALNGMNVRQDANAKND